MSNNETSFEPLGLVLNVKPLKLKSPQIVFNAINEKTGKKMAPHVKEHKDVTEFRLALRQELDAVITGTYKIPVEITFVFYMPDNRLTYVSGLAYETSRCLVPTLIEHYGLIRKTTEIVWYPNDSTYKGKPRIEVIICPRIE